METKPETAGTTVAAFQKLHVDSQQSVQTGREMHCISPSDFSGFFLAVHLVYLTSFTLFLKLLSDRDVQSFCFQSHSVSFQLLCRHIFSLRVSLAFLLKFQGIQRKVCVCVCIHIYIIICSVKRQSLRKWSILLLKNPVYSLCVFTHMDSFKPT